MQIALTALVTLVLLLPASLPAGEPLWTQVAQLYGSDINAEDSFGESAAIDGDTLAVAAYRKSGGGAVYIFKRSPEAPTEWVETKKLTPQFGDTFFGLVLAIDGDTLAVMAEVTGAEALYLFERDFGGEDAWGLVRRFQGEEVSSLGLDEDTLGVGDRNFDLGGQLNVGAVYMLERGPGGPTDWKFLTTLTASDADAQGRFGDVQALSGDRLLIGVPDDDFGDDTGAAYVFERDESGEWTEVAKLFQPEPDENDDFGWAVDLDVDTALVGNDGGIGTEGAFVFGRDDASGDWVFIEDLHPSEGGSQGFGVSVGLSGNVVAVGGTGHDLPDVENAGAVFVYERHTGGTDTWGEVAKLLATDPEELDAFGDVTRVDGNTLVVGVHQDDDLGRNAGTVYLFSRTEPLLSIRGTCPGELSVSVIGTTPSGRVLLLGAQSEGVTVVPSGPCTGLEVDLANPRLFFDGTATSGGDLLLTPEVGAGTCGRLVQAVDVDTCATTEVLEIP